MAWVRRARLRHTDEFHGLGGGDRLKHGVGVGQTDVLAGVGDEPPGDDPGVGPHIDEPGKPGDGGVGVPAPGGFCKRPTIHCNSGRPPPLIIRCCMLCSPMDRVIKSLPSGSATVAPTASSRAFSAVRTSPLAVTDQ